MAHEKSVTDWQPIETAPRDGADILLLRLSEGNGLFWVGSHTLHEYFRNGVRESGHESWGYPGMNSLDVKPTHWMPLPSTARL